MRNSPGSNAPERLVFAVITCHNEKPSVLRCLHQLGVSDPNISVVLVDDGSSDGTAEDVGVEFPDVVVVRGHGDLWWSGATNLGTQEALKRGATSVIFLNNDCLLPGRGIGDLIAASELHPKTIVSATIGDLADGSPVSFGGQFTKTGVDYILSEPPTDADGLATVDWLPGHAVVMPSTVFSDAGFCDAVRFPQYFGDTDFFLRARRAGYRLTVMPSIMVLNDRSQTGLRLKYPIRPKNLWTVLTHQRSALRVTDNVRFFMRHRDTLSMKQLVGRYQIIPEVLAHEFIDKTNLRGVVRRIRRRKNT